MSYGASEAGKGERNESAGILCRSLGRSHHHRHRRAADVLQDGGSAQRDARFCWTGFRSTAGLIRTATAGAGGRGKPGELLIRWAIGAVLRLFVLVLYAPLARIINLSVEAALVSLVTFFFMTMMAEPLLLEYDR